MSDRPESPRGGVRALLRFMAAYAALLTVVFYLLPAAGRLLEAVYDTLDGPTKLVIVAIAALLIAAWRVVGRYRQAR
jgi:hypothetical protein